MTKMGESQIIEFFSGILRDELQQKFGKYAKYTIGNFSGSQDRKFADFFAGTDSVNILVEFKEKKSEHKAEEIKPLREKLCLTLNDEIASISRLCHFIGWGGNKKEIRVELNPYIDLVCRLWNCTDCLLTPVDHVHNKFIANFINGNVGVDHSTFVQYIEHLNTTAGGSATGENVLFRSILYSRDSSGQLIGTRFENLDQLNELRKIESPEPDYGPSLYP
jgi:hypothetical protein